MAEEKKVSIDDLDARIRALETQFQQISRLRPLAAGISSGNCTNDCTYGGCTDGCTHGCTGAGCLVELPPVETPVEKAGG